MAQVLIMIVLFIFQVDPFDSITAHRQCLSTVSRYGQKNNSYNYTYVYILMEFSGCIILLNVTYMYILDNRENVEFNFLCDR